MILLKRVRVMSSCKGFATQDQSMAARTPARSLNGLTSGKPYGWTNTTV